MLINLDVLHIGVEIVVGHCKMEEDGVLLRDIVLSNIIRVSLFSVADRITDDLV